VAHEHQILSDLFIDFSDENPSTAAHAEASASMGTQSGMLIAQFRFQQPVSSNFGLIYLN
jgi:hypothetical protein